MAQFEIANTISWPDQTCIQAFQIKFIFRQKMISLELNVNHMCCVSSQIFLLLFFFCVAARDDVCRNKLESFYFKQAASLFILLIEFY